MTDSILNSVKKVLGMEPTYTAFDQDILLFTNSALSDVTQLGIGPHDGFEISDATATWADFLGGDKKMNGVKELICLKVRLVFDPPPTGPATSALEKIIEQKTWRVSVEREGTMWTDPDPGRLPATNPMGDAIVVDGGTG